MKKFIALVITFSTHAWGSSEFIQWGELQPHLSETTARILYEGAVRSRHEGLDGRWCSYIRTTPDLTPEELEEITRARRECKVVINKLDPLPIIELRKRSQ